MSPATTSTRRSGASRRRTDSDAGMRPSERCPDTGRLMPECGCCACGRRLVARYAPHLARD